MSSLESAVSTMGGAGDVPVVLAFAPAWDAHADPGGDLRAIRAELRALGAVLVVLSDAGIWTFRPDEAAERRTPAGPEAAREVDRVAACFGLARTPDGAAPTAVVVLDADAVVRHAQTLGPEGVRPARALREALCAARRNLAGVPARTTISRRELVASSLVAGFALSFAAGCRRTAPPASGVAQTTPPAPAADDGAEVDLLLHVNGGEHRLRIDPRVSLLDALRERLDLPGTKKGCDHGQCGACTVLVDGRRVLSCLTLAVTLEGAKITTIEGLGQADRLHPVQQAFAELDALQCGYCTPGQIMSAVGLLAEGHARTDDEVREQMSGNLCRCGAYPNIVAAVQRARSGT